MNDCKTEIILCSWKDCLWSFFLPKHVICLLSGSAAARMQIWMFRYDFFKVLIDHGWIVVIQKLDCVGIGIENRDLLND